MSFGLVLGIVGDILLFILLATPILLAGLGVSFVPLGILAGVIVCGWISDLIPPGRQATSPRAPL